MSDGHDFETVKCPDCDIAIQRKGISEIGYCQECGRELYLHEWKNLNGDEQERESGQSPNKELPTAAYLREFIDSRSGNAMYSSVDTRSFPELEDEIGIEVKDSELVRREDAERYARDLMNQAIDEIRQDEELQRRVEKGEKYQNGYVNGMEEERRRVLDLIDLKLEGYSGEEYEFSDVEYGRYKELKKLRQEIEGGLSEDVKEELREEVEQG